MNPAGMKPSDATANKAMKNVIIDPNTMLTQANDYQNKPMKSRRTDALQQLLYSDRHEILRLR
jgi:hypothetical protein